MKKVCAIILGIILCSLVTAAAKADELKVNVSVENGEAVTKVLGADIYANIDDQPYNITIRPEDQAFFLKGKFGALNITSFWQTNAKTRKIVEE